MSASAIAGTTSTTGAAVKSDSSAERKEQKGVQGLSTDSSIAPVASSSSYSGEPFLIIKKPDYNFPDESPYYGPLDKEGLPSGVGSVSYIKGGSYLGAFLKGVKEGHGIQQIAGGGRYEGQFSGDKYHGEGVLITPSNEKYEGTFMNGDFKKGKYYPDMVKNPEKFQEYVPPSSCIIS